MIYGPSAALLLVVCLLPATLLVVVLHEAGHALAARMVGLQVFAWGVGFRKPWLRARTGQSIFYVSWPLTTGVTIFCRRLIEREPVPEFTLILGGPIASLVGMLIGWVAWSSGWQSVPLLAWNVMAAIFCVASFVPMTVRMGVMRLESDATRLIEIVRFRRQTAAYPLGPALTNSEALASLLSAVGSTAGAAFFRLPAAMMQAALGDVAAARESLALGEAGACAEVPSAAAIAALVRAVLAVEEDADDALSICAAAEQLGRTDATAVFTLDCLREQWRLHRGEDVTPQLDQLRARAVAAARSDWLCTVDVVAFGIDTPDQQANVRCRELLNRHRRYLSNESKVRLLGLTTERLAVSGQTELARAFFAETQAVIAADTATISSPTTRQAYVRQAAAPLQRAIAACPDTPLFIADGPALPPPRKGIFAYATGALGIACGGVVMLCLIRRAVDRVPLEEDFMENAFTAISMFWFSALMCTLISLLRREQKHKALAVGMLLAFVGLMFTAIATPWFMS